MNTDIFEGMILRIRLGCWMAAISIIVPVYNVEFYLGKCLKSILDQTFQDFEVILVDDGSTDGSGKICDEYTGKYENIRVIHKMNEGVSSARNRGLEESTSDIVTFIDSDDWIDKYYLEVLYKLMTGQRADLVLSRGIDVLDMYCSEERRLDWKEVVSNAELISKSEAYRRILLCEHNISVVTWGKLYRKKIFEKVRYPIGELCEDSGVIDKIIEGCDRIICTQYAGYYHLRRKGSLMHGEMTPEYMSGIKNAKHLWEFVRENYSDIEDSAKIFYLNNCIQLINYMIIDGKGRYRTECEWLRREVMKEKLFLLFNRYTGIEEKGAVICLLFGISWYRKIWRVYLKVTGKALGTVM